MNEDFDDLDMDDADIDLPSGAGDGAVEVTREGTVPVLQSQADIIEREQSIPSVDERNPARVERLVAQFDAQGRPHVRRTRGGRPTEAWRRPTPEEFEALRSRGQLVRGGLQRVAPMGAVEERKTLAPWVGVAMLGGAFVGGIFACNWWKNRGKKDLR